jgi:hypothetical protein
VSAITVNTQERSDRYGNVVKVDLQDHNDRYGRELCRYLEQGGILLLTTTPFMPDKQDCELLRSGQQSDSASHKNIAYKPHLGRTTGVDDQQGQLADRVNGVLARYSAAAIKFLSSLLTAYSADWRVDYASFRPVEEQGRSLPLKRRNDLIHIDAFPTRPTHGDRILRAFTNLHPERPRVWALSDPFPTLAEQYAVAAGLRRTVGPLATARRVAAQAAHRVGAPVPDRSPYDEFMLGFHHYLKSNDQFQHTGCRQTVSFAPGETWISFTDQVAHAVVSGQYALEQTFIVPYTSLLEPSLAPLSILEGLAGQPLVASSRSRGRRSAEMDRVHAN